MDRGHNTDREKQTIGEFIQARREALGLTRPAAAERADIDPSYWRRIEVGDRKEPNPQVLHRIAEVIDWNLPFSRPRYQRAPSLLLT